MCWNHRPEGTRFPSVGELNRVWKLTTRGTQGFEGVPKLMVNIICLKLMFFGSCEACNRPQRVVLRPKSALPILASGISIIHIPVSPNVDPYVYMVQNRINTVLHRITVPYRITIHTPCRTPYWHNTDCHSQGFADYDNALC
jgi:hypothetical protein